MGAPKECEPTIPTGLRVYTGRSHIIKQQEDLSIVERRIDALFDENDHDGPAPVDITDMYIDGEKRSPRLTRTEEITLAKRMELGKHARASLVENGPNGRLIKKQRQTLPTIIQEGLDAENRLVDANRGLVVNFAKSYIGKTGSYEFIDCIQEGNLALIRAAKKFDYRRAKYSTYATTWIKQGIDRALDENSRTVRIPVGLAETYKSMRHVIYELSQEYGRKPTIPEIARAMKKPEKKIANIIKIMRQPLSLDKSEEFDDGVSDDTLADMLEDTTAASPEEDATQAFMRKQLLAVLDTLPSDERRILKLCFGLIDGVEYTPEEIRKMLGITRERVNLLKKRGLKTLRETEGVEKLREYLL
jgi:RNA polymerase sigma factor (sigma-70 family)